MSVKRRESLHSATPRRQRPARVHDPVALAAKKAQFEGVEMPTLRVAKDEDSERRVFDDVDPQAARSFTRIAANADESIDVDIPPMASI